MRKNMNNLILVTPTKEHESQVMEFREEMLKNGEGFYGCSGLNSVSSYDEWLNFEGRFERLGWTPSATYPDFFRSHTAVRIVSILSRLILKSPARV